MKQNARRTIKRKIKNRSSESENRKQTMKIQQEERATTSQEPIHDQIEIRQLGADDEEDKESFEDHATKPLTNLESWKDSSKTSCE